jgi:hypothetical protein
METGPRPIVETLVGAFLPPVCREHVLGDLYERFTSPRQYFLDAIQAVPLVVVSQILRTSTIRLRAAEFGAVYQPARRACVPARDRRPRRVQASLK